MFVSSIDLPGGLVGSHETYQDDGPCLVKISPLAIFLPTFIAETTFCGEAKFDENDEGRED